MRNLGHPLGVGSLQAPRQRAIVLTMGMAQVPRKRTAKRAAARAQAKLVQARKQLFELEPGGSAQRPLEVPSASVIEGRTRSFSCPQCDRELLAAEHRAVVHKGVRLREVHARCSACGDERKLWFRVLPQQLN
jgi:hypothetical protein